MTDGTVVDADQRDAAAGANLVNFLRGQRGLEGFVAARRDQAVPKPRQRARRHRQRPAHLRAGPVRVYADPGYTRLQDGQRRPHADAVCRRQRRHAARVLRRHEHHRPQGGKEAWAVDAGGRAAAPFKLADNNYRTSTSTTSTARRASATCSTARRLEDDPGRRPERGRPGLLRARHHRSRHAQGHCGSSSGATPATTRRTRPRRGSRLPPRPDVRQAADQQARRRPLGGHGDLGLQQRERDAQGRRRQGLPLRPQRGHRRDHLQDRDHAPATRPRRAAWRRSTTSSTKAEIDNTTVRVYGTDVLGNIWRFDVNDNRRPRAARRRSSAPRRTRRRAAADHRPAGADAVQAASRCSSSPPASCSAPPTSTDVQTAVDLRHRRSGDRLATAFPNLRGAWRRWR